MSERTGGTPKPTSVANRRRRVRELGMWAHHLIVSSNLLRDNGLDGSAKGCDELAERFMVEKRELESGL